LVKINWEDAQGKKVPLDEPAVTGYLRGATAVAETEFPTTRGTNADGWTEMSDTYQAPSQASRAVVELHLQWAPAGEVRYPGGAAAAEPPPPARRRAGRPPPPSGHAAAKPRKATPTPTEPLIAEAARQQTALVVLGETLTYYGLGKPFADVAEPVPGPSTEY